METMDLHLSFLLVFLLTQSASPVELPPFIHVCHQSDPELEQCIINAVEEVKPILVTGAPEYNIPSVEPMIIEDFIEEESSGLTIQVKDVSTCGGSQFTVEKISLHRDPMSFTAQLIFPQMKINATYNMHGKILVLPIKSSGEFRANLTNIKSTNTMVGELYEKDSTKYVKLISNDIKLSVESGHVHLENAHADTIINDMISETVNKNFHDFFHELMPVIEKNLGELMLNISNKIVEPYPYDLMFPE
nr:protein takeout-like isoform X2 [Onthophagus taurus]